MTTLGHHDSLAEIRARLESVAFRRRTICLLTGLAAMTTLLASGLVLAAAAGGYWQGPPPQALRTGLCVMLCAVWVLGAWWFIARELLRTQNDAQIARYVEQAIPGLHNGLINSILLAGDDEQVAPDLVRRVIDEAADEARGVDLARSVSLRPLKRWALAAAGACVVFGAFASLQASPFWRGVQAVLAPGRTLVELERLAPGDATVELGEDITIRATLSNDGGWPVRARIVFADGTSRDMTMTDDHKVFALPLGPAVKGLRYAMEVDGLRWPREAGSFYHTRVAVPLVDNGLTPKDTTVFIGDPVTVRAEIRKPAVKGDQADAEAVEAAVMAVEAVVIFDNGDRKRMDRMGKDGRVFCWRRGEVMRSFGYAVRIGDSRWPTDESYYTVTVIKRVEIDGVQLRYEYPAYTRLGDKTTQTAPHGASIKVPMGTRVTVVPHLTGQASKVVLKRRDMPDVAMMPSPDGRTCSASFVVLADSQYRLIVHDAKGHVTQYPEADDEAGQAAWYRIRAVPDPAPKVEFVSPARDISAAPGETVHMRIKASDTYGLAGVTLMAGPEGDEPDRVHAWPLEAKSSGVFEFKYVVDKALADDKGLVIVYFATAGDSRNLPPKMGPQTSISSRYRIRVENSVKVAAERAKRHEELRRRLFALLELQLPQRVNTGLCLQRHKRLLVLTAEKGPAKTVAGIRAEVKKVSAEIHTVQGKIRNEMADIVKTFPFDAEMATIQQALALLAANEATAAIEQAAVFAGVLKGETEKVPDVAMRRDQAGGALGRTQHKIINTLETLLAIMPSLAGKTGEKHQPDGSDVPAEVREKLKKLTSELEKFIDAEKKAIEATKRLVKKPVDTFNADDEKLLKELLQTQDKWEKFLNESFADFSKLAEQDFSNPAMLKELLSVKNDVTMAKDALSKKAAEIATPAEENAAKTVEEMEMDNIEKWLPDTPDRTKWSMEDPEGGQKNDEMTELPTELEDLVGDLLEEEEDLFEDMADLSAKSSTSGEKGLGWDAMDGPISSMAAKGVTGNQLPNPSEISGRSGEGRTGKSTGEFVEDKAVGKGGRRTPTRLTPEPFQKGQVDDKSTEPPGGATGGGKFSGSGAAGLEGPVPPEVAKELKRMAGKQAELVNRAERIRSQFKVGDYSNFKLLQAITLMDRVRGDLERFRFRNALRHRKDTVGAIRQTQMLLAGRIDVTVDASSAMPKYLRKDINDARNGKLPAEYKAALEAYYKRISEGK